MESWCKTREYASRSLVFQSANAGFGAIARLTLCGIGSAQNPRPDFQAWRYMAFAPRGGNENTCGIASGDPCFWFAGINAFLSSVPNGGITTFVTIISADARFMAGRTKRRLTSSFTFVGYSVGNMVGSRIFKAKDAFLALVAWRAVLALRNRRRDSRLCVEVLTEEDRVARSRELGSRTTPIWRIPP
ncbi:hypothetical protein DL770_003838 [Monosporascus sp. CRB-9-2]|nr:hypothetical protein DL770_003838 [Monosporascus sp. CRB-9-2]